VTTLDPKANGIALGFYEETRNGRRIIGHGGDTIAFHSDMHLIPSENFGFFVSYNSSGRGDTSARGPLWRKFLDRYFPDPNAPAPKVAQGSAGDVAGSYITSRRPATSIITAFGALSQATVTANADGTIEVDQLTGLNGKPKKWEPIAPLAFREANGRDQLLFADVGGRLTMLTAGAGVIVYQKTTFFESALFLLSVFGISAAVLLLNLVLWPVAAMARRHYGINQEWTFSEHLLRFLVMASSAALLTLIIGFGAVLGPLLDDPWKLDATLDKPLRMLQYIGLAGAAGSLIAVYNAAQSWTNPVRRVLGRLKETLVAAAMLGLTWFCWTMNLFDLSLRY
jgi:hypothetical protein